MVGPEPMCYQCKHFLEESDGIWGYHCRAFPDDIPDEIFSCAVDHRKPYPGDHGIQFESKE